ncbi:MAG: hypothetical protein ACTHL0_06545, partial [Trinickia sp.]
MPPAAVHRLSAADRHLRKQASAAAPSIAEMSAAGLRAFFNIARDWGLGIDEQIVLLGSPGRS